MSQPFSPDAFATETLRLLGPDPANWVPDLDGIDHNVLIVGGGHTGSALSFALRRAGIGHVSVIDRAENEDSSSIWRTVARMDKLRTPKTLSGPELGHVGLSFQAWYEARHGREAYAAIDRIARTDWADYLAWYRKTLGIDIRYQTELLRIEPVAGHFRLHLKEQGREKVETARKIILATGFAGSGGPFIPTVFSQLPSTLFAHTSESIDFAALKGADVAVVGGAASAFDAAATALEAGAASVHLFARRPTLAASPVIQPRAYPGAYDNYPLLPDAIRWRQALRYRRSGTTAPKDTLERALRHHNFNLHLGITWDDASVDYRKVVLTNSGRTERFDFVIAGTGYTVDLARQQELADFHSQIALWRDRYSPAADEQDEAVGNYPYLTPGLALQERQTGAAPYLANIHLFNPAGFVSQGLPIGDVPSFKRDIPALVQTISRDLFFADLPLHEARFFSEVKPDFDPTFYAASVRSGLQQTAAE